MDNTNCTFNMDGKPARARLTGVTEFGFDVEVSAVDYAEYIGHEVGPGIATISIPGVPSSLIALDDSVTVVEQLVTDMDLTVDSLRTIEHDVSEWKWRDE